MSSISNVKTKKQILRSSSVKNDFWSLAGSLNSIIKLSNKELRQARNEFSKNWAQI